MPYTPQKARPSITTLAIIVLLLSFSVSAYSQTRELLPTPPGGGQGSSVIEADMAIPYTQKTDAQAYELLNQDITPNPKVDVPIGGDDILIETFERYSDSDMAIAENGDIYVAVSAFGESTLEEIHILRSTNGGDSFSLWGNLGQASDSGRYRDPSIVIGEGVDPKLHMVYWYVESGIYSQIRMISADLSDYFADFSSEIVVMEEDGTSFSSPDIATDSDSWSSYYLYVTAVGNDYQGPDIWYARCTNQGTSFDDAYEIATLAYDDRSYRNPDISYGLGGFVHVVWSFGLDDNSIDRSLRYRRIGDYGGGGIANWGPNLSPTPHYNGMWEIYPHIEASQTTNDVLISYWRALYMGGGIISPQGFGVVPSYDAGSTLGSEIYGADMVGLPQDIAFQPSTGDFILAIEIYGDFGLQRANRANLSSWSDFGMLGDISYSSSTFPPCGMDLDSSHDGRAAFAWIRGGTLYDPNSLFMDAEWRADPGYPNLEEGFPIALADSPRSAPGVVDLDGDGDLEIFFADNGGNIQMLHHDGTPVDGWPVYIGYPSTSPIAVGDLVGHGQQVVVVGTITGLVYAFDQHGNLLDGFPYDFGSYDHVHLCLGAMGDRFARTIVAAAGTKLHFINPQGERVPGSIAFDTYTHNIDFPPVVGDINGDGINEVVWAFDNYVIATNMMTTGTVIYNSFDYNISGTPTLADADLDGTLEVAVPLWNGQLHLLDGDGSEMPGFPVTTASETRLSSVAWAQLLGTYEPELAFAADDHTVELFYTDGTRPLNWPHHTSVDWWLLGSPILGRINGTSSDVIIGDGKSQLWAWDNGGYLIPGWPRMLDGLIEFPPAMGDLDLDGNAEVVVLSQGQLAVFDVNNSMSGVSHTWPMAGHNSRRTGCFNCAEDLTTSVPEEDNDPGENIIATRVSFATPVPNPASGSTVFAYAVPVLSQVRLEVFDIRGHRVRTVVKAEVAAGYHTIAWDCRDDFGRQLPSGTYFGCLRARGDGVNQEITRKINVIR